jgi:hypothetical protein
VIQTLTDSSHPRAAAHRGLRGHRTTETRHRVGYGKEGARTRLADRQNDHRAQACRSSFPILIAQQIVDPM